MNLLGKPTIEFCEQAGAGLIKRPFYALSNIAYIFVGFLILSKKTRFSKIFGLTALFIGLASFLYDASYTYISQLVDLLGMLIFINVLIFLSARLYFTKVSKQILVILQALAVVFGMLAIIYYKSFAGEFVFGTFIVVEILLQFLLYKEGRVKNSRLWMYGLGLFLFGFGIWLLDASHLLCDPTNILNGRSVFHLLTSGSIYYLYKYFEDQS